MSKVFFGVFWPGGVIFINLISPISILSKDKEILILLSIFPQQPKEQREQHMEQSMFGCIEVLNKDEEENVVAGQERHRVQTQVITRLRVRAGQKYATILWNMLAKNVLQIWTKITQLKPHVQLHMA